MPSSSSSSSPRPAAPAATSNGTAPSADDIQRQLRLKRAETDAEIAAFRRRKEAEYVAFEQELVAQAVGTPRPPSGGGGTSSAAPAVPPPPVSTGPPKDGTTEEELRSLFNLSYLPLLEGAAKGSTTGGSGSSSAAAQAIDKTKVSSSFTLPSSTYRPPTPPGTAQQQASSAPRPSLTHHHRSSSRSDTSPSLRSSLKGTSAKSEERSPKAAKHVLFRLDGGGVIAPSSSPIVERKMDGGVATSDAPTRLTSEQQQQKPGKSKAGDTSDTSTAQKSGASILATDGASPASASASQSTVSTTIPVLRTPTTPTTPPSSSSGKSPGMGQSYALLDTSAPTPVNSGEAEEFDLAGGADPLFDMDDEGSLPPSLPEDESEPDDAHAASASASSAVETGGRAVTGSSSSRAKEPASPHAGSVPIEIKWPGRK